MSYSICLKCRELVKGDIKYCSVCQKKYGLPNTSGRQLADFKTHEIFDAWAKKEVEKDLKDKGGKK